MHLKPIPYMMSRFTFQYLITLSSISFRCTTFSYICDTHRPSPGVRKLTRRRITFAEQSSKVFFVSNFEHSEVAHWGSGASARGDTGRSSYFVFVPGEDPRLARPVICKSGNCFQLVFVADVLLSCRCPVLNQAEPLLRPLLPCSLSISC